MSVRRQHPFTLIPNWVIEAGVSSRAIHAYVVLGTFADKQGSAHPSRRTIAERMGCSRDTADRALAELEAASALEIRERTTAQGDPDTNEYLLMSTPPVRTGAEGIGANAQGGAGKTAHRGLGTSAAQNKNQLELDPVEPEKSIASVGKQKYPAAFEAFWTAFPRRVGKEAAFVRWKKIVGSGVEPDHLLDAAARAAIQYATTDSRFIPHPARWLNERRDLDPPDSAGPNLTNSQRAVANVARGVL